jgi:hyperosmotically inducible periplasmic protein
MQRTMKWMMVALLGAAFIVFTGAMSACAVTRGQSSVGEYLDDAAITSAIKARFASASSVDATAISVETLNGEVQLSGFARTAGERSDAERIARSVHGVKVVRNDVRVRG